MYFMEIFPDLLSLFSNVTGFVTNKVLSFPIPITFKLIDERNSSEKFYFYYAEDDAMRKSKVTWDPSKERRQKYISAPQDIEQLGRALIITNDGFTYTETAALTSIQDYAPILESKKVGYKEVASYEVRFTLRKEAVFTELWFKPVMDFGGYGGLTAGKAELYPDSQKRYGWWGIGSTTFGGSERENLINKCISVRNS